MSKPHHPNGFPRRAWLRPHFTIVELLVVIGIIVILAGLLLPALSGARRQGKQADCINNVRQLTLATDMYTSSYDGHFPWSTQGGGGAGQTGGWVFYSSFSQDQGGISDFDPSRGTLFEHVNQEEVYRCPLDETESKVSYGINGDTSDLAAGGPRRRDAVPMPARTPLFLEEGATAETTNDGYFNIWWNPPDHVVNRHRDGSVYSFCDGHVKWHRYSDREVYEACNFLGLPEAPNWP